MSDRTISTKDLNAKLKKITLVETLARERFLEGHLPGAVNLPPDAVKEMAAKVLPNKSAEIVTYCANAH